MSDKLKDIDIENHIWIIYILVILASWYSNSLEKKYFIFNDYKAKDKYQKTLIRIFSILLVIYLYFFKSSYDDVINLKLCDSIKKRKLTELSAISSLLIVISGLIFLYIACNDNDIDVEIAFN